MNDFFISYTTADESAAEWVAYELDEAGYTVTFMKWDFKAGSNFVIDMQKAAEECERILPILSPNYFQSAFTQPEWAVAFGKDPTGEKGLLIPVRAKECDLKGLWPQIVYIDLFNKKEDEARKTLLAKIEQAVKSKRLKAKTRPKFEGFTGDAHTRKPRYPGTLPPYWNMPIQQNQHFTGREEILAQLQESLEAEHGAALTQMLKGLGGIGKTQIAVEYVYRHHTKYDIVWWVNAETEVTIQTTFALLAEELELVQKDAREQEIKVQAALKYLNQNPRWLLIFDNVESGDAIYAYRPQHHQGHVIITTRNQSLQGAGENIKIDSWTNEEAQQFVKTRINNANQNDINDLCEVLGNLPLAMEQAVSYIVASGLPISDYIELFNKNQQKYLSKSSIPKEEYNETVATTWTLAIQKIQESMPVAIELFNMCAFMAPDDIPLYLIAKQADVLSESMQELLGDKGEMAEMHILFKRYSIANIKNETLSMHRLVQAVIRYGLADEQAKQILGFVVEVIAKSFHGLNPQHDVNAWPTYKVLHTHILICGKYAQEHEVNLEIVGFLYNELGLYLDAIGHYEQVESLFIKSRDIKEKILGKENASYSTSLNNLAELYRIKGQHGKAEPLYKEARDIYAKVHGKEHPAYATSLNNLAELYRVIGQYDKAEPLYIESLDVIAKVLGKEGIDYAISLNNLAELYSAQGQYDKAEPLYIESRDIRAEVLGNEHPAYATSLNNLASLYKAQGQYDKAEPLYIESRDITAKVNGKKHPNYAISLNNLAELYRFQSQYGKAEPLYIESRDIRAKVHGKKHSAYATSLNNLALLYDDQGQYGKAEPLYLEAIKILENVFGPEHPNAITIRNNYQRMLDKKSQKR